MSTIDKLKQAQLQRTGEIKGTTPEGVTGTVPVGRLGSDPIKVIMGTVPEGRIMGTDPEGACSHYSRTWLANPNWLIGSILLILIIFNLVFSFKLFSMIKDNNAKGNNSLKNLSIVGKVVTDHSNKITNLSSDFKQLEKQIDNQATTIEKLIKANNTLFTRINLLESKLDQILKQTN
jgi:hypothetical protein